MKCWTSLKFVDIGRSGFFLFKEETHASISLGVFANKEDYQMQPNDQIESKEIIFIFRK